MFNLAQYPDETYEDYFVRLFEHKQEYGLNCEDIADLLNEVKGTHFDSSAFRKEYAAFNRGRIYERSLATRNVAERVLVLSDLHVPFQLPVSEYSAYAGRVDTLVINGDLLDHPSISKFVKKYHLNPIDEMIECRKYIIDLIELLAPERVIVTIGNHDKRFGDYLANKLDNEMQELLPNSALDLLLINGFYHYDKLNHTKVWYKPIVDVFPDLDIQYDGAWFVQIGDTIMCHPLAFSGGIMKTSEKAVKWFRDEGYVFSNLVMAHTHRTGEYMMGNTLMIESGCCCDTNKLDYVDGRLTTPQKQGYVYLSYDKEGRMLRDKAVYERLN